ncbi:MAG: ribulose-phosphate 3-epimerase, partial [Clostridia bacterium]|nr:ribulose-phosphate 3-epimerase [Clostridia bacterium]
IDETIRHIESLGKHAGLTVKPNTPVETVFPYLDKLALVLVMTVEPGFGGQSFMADQLTKVAALRAEIDRRGLSTLIEVDGGVGRTTAEACARAGADVAVVGSALFEDDDPAGLVSLVQSL